METVNVTDIAHLQHSLSRWTAAIDAMLAEVERVRKGGEPDPGRLADLLAGVASARLGCGVFLRSAFGQTQHDA